MAKLGSVIRHAITAPTFDRTKVHRERLVDDIHANIPRKLIAIAAPPGYGKTTLLADFTAHTDLPVCWVRLSDADRDVYHFADLLNISLQKRFRRLHSQLDLENLAGSSSEALAGVFVSIIDENVSEAFVIILDDVHLVNSSKATTSFIDAFLENMPEQVTVISAGREVLEVSLARLMAEGNLGGLGPQDLALTGEEVIALAAQQSGIDLSGAHAERLLDETKGWVTGLLLSGELSGQDLPSLVFEARPMVYEYLASVVLNRQPDDLRRFMLDTAIFPVMTVAGCNEVLDREDSQKYLTRLVQRGLFVSATNETPRTYEYHPMYREFLLESLESADEARLNKLRNRAADYLTEHGSIEHAIEMYYEAGSIQKAARLAEKHAREMYWSGRWRTLEIWSRLLVEHDAIIPYVNLLLAQYYTDQGNLDLAESTHAEALGMIEPRASNNVKVLAQTVRGQIARRRGQWDIVLEAVESAETIMSQRGTRLGRAECYRLRAFARAQRDGDHASAARLVEKAVALLKKTDYRYSLANAMTDLVIHYLAIGQAAQARATILEAHDLFLQLKAPYPLAISFNNLAMNSFISGEYQDAMRLFNEGLKYVRQAASSSTEAIILFGQADLFSDLDLALQAAELYGQGLSLATQLDNVELIVYGCTQTSVLYRRRESQGLANEWLRRAVSVDDTANPSVQVQIQLSALELNTRPESAKDQMETLLTKADSLDAASVTQAQYFLGRAQLASGELDTAINTFEQVLDWAGANGTEQILTGELAVTEDVLEFIRKHLSTHPVFSMIIRRIETTRAVSQQYQQLPEESISADQISFFALGRADVAGSVRPLAELKPLPREILFYLVDGGRVERDILLENFWPHYPPGRQVANLHTAIYSLRQFLGRKAILHEGSVYAIDPDLSIEYDVAQFERMASIVDSLPLGDPRRMFALTEAISSYGGTFLPQMTSEWILERRRELELAYLDLLAQHANEALIRDQPTRALKTLRQALDIDPYRDDTNLHFLEALGRLGRRSEAIDHYQRYVRLLADELSLDPPEEIRDLYTRLIG